VRYNEDEKFKEMVDPKKFNIGFNIWLICLFVLSLFVLILTVTYSVVDFIKWQNQLVNQTTAITDQKNIYNKINQ
jgi:hypothetical protein